MWTWYVVRCQSCVFCAICLYVWVFVCLLCLPLLLSRMIVYRNNSIMISYFVSIRLLIFVYTHTFYDWLFLFCFSGRSDHPRIARPTVRVRWLAADLDRNGWRPHVMLCKLFVYFFIYKCFPIDAWKNFEYWAAGFSWKLSEEKHAPFHWNLCFFCVGCVVNSFPITSQQNWQIIIIFSRFFFGSITLIRID